MIKSEDVEAMYIAILKFVEQRAESKAEIISFMMFITYRCAKDLDIQIDELNALENECEKAVLRKQNYISKHNTGFLS